MDNPFTKRTFDSPDVDRQRYSSSSTTRRPLLQQSSTHSYYSSNRNGYKEVHDHHQQLKRRSKCACFCKVSCILLLLAVSCLFVAAVVLATVGGVFIKKGKLSNHCSLLLHVNRTLLTTSVNDLSTVFHSIGSACSNNLPFRLVEIDELTHTIYCMHITRQYHVVENVTVVVNSVAGQPNLLSVEATSKSRHGKFVSTFLISFHFITMFY